MNLKEQIEKYTPFNPQEEKDKAFILKLFNSKEELFTRENNVAHFTASAWVLNPERTKVLMVHHNIYNSWAWMGGHADGERDLLAVAMREAREESGIKDIKPICEDIFGIAVIAVAGHEKYGEYISSHLHLDVVYLLEAAENQTLAVNLEENSGVAWISVDDIKNKSNEKWFIERIYSKLTEKTK